MDDLKSLIDDGLTTPEVGDWAREKYDLVRYYADVFTRAMSGKFRLAYVDLFAAAGHARVRGWSDRIVAASPMVVLDLPVPFSKYIFSELDEMNAAALRTRATSHAPSRVVHVHVGDSNEDVVEIAAQIPKKSLTFCFADPFKLENLRFSTIRHLAESGKVDFLVLIPTHMDANRNVSRYLADSSKAIENFVGANDWRDRWPSAAMDFGDFVADEFGRSMKRLGYIYTGLETTKVVRNSKRSPIYRLAFFSRVDLGLKFWSAARTGTDPQRPLF